MTEERTTTTELPGEMILSEIVTRLPVKSVVRFRSVCKQWHSFLNTPTFYNLHLHHNHYNNQKLLVTSITTTATAKPLGVKFFSIDCEAPDDGFTSLTAPFKLQAGLDCTVLTSCNGMVCLGMKKKRIGFYHSNFVDFILWNPSISEYKTLSKTNSHTQCYEDTYGGFNMYYSCYEDDYRILRMVEASDNAYLYSLKSDSWRKLVMDSSSKVAWGSYNWMPSVVFVEKVFLLNQDDENIWVIRFDTKTEKFAKMKTQFSKDLPKDRGLIVVDRGCFHLRAHHHYDDCTLVEVLTMDGDGEWTPIGSYSSKYGLECLYYQPLHLLRNGNWLMHDQGYLYSLYPNGRKLGSRLNRKKKMRIAAEGKYIETFVSPNRYMQISPTS